MNILQFDGKPISKPGIYKNFPISLYHGDACVGPSISSSGLRTIFNQSPAHYFATSYLNPDRVETEESKALLFGRALHFLVLGEDHFRQQFVIRPDQWDSWRTKDAKAWREAMISNGMTVLQPDDIFLIRDMAKSLEKHPLIRAGILNGVVEASGFLEDEKTGVWQKIRPDCLPASADDVADLKSTISVSTRAIERSISDYGYFIQGALVRRVYRELVGRPVTSFNLVFIEKTPPYCVRVVTLKDADLELGERIVRAATDLFAQCVKTGSWPGPGDQNDASYVEIDPWERKRLEERVSLMEQGILE